MQGAPNIVNVLNTELTNELTATNQYFLHARMYRHWGFHELAEKEYNESIDEMKHADKLIKRILVLNGLPNLQTLHKLLVGENVPEMLKGDLQLEQAAQQTLKNGIAECEKAADFESRDILQDILDETEDHIDWIETQIDLINKVGEQNYLQAQMGGH